MRVVSLFGTGDTYLVCGLLRSAMAHHGVDSIELTVKSHHVGIPEMFGLPYEVDNERVHWGETAQAAGNYDNDLHDPWRHFFAHPRFSRSRVAIDQLTALPFVSQADMYRCLLQLPIDAELERARPIEAETEPRTVVIIPRSKSWPVNYEGFWSALNIRLHSAGWQVVVNDDEWSLVDLLRTCSQAEWVIGPQCGVMSILCHAGFRCRKTFVTGDVYGMKFDRFPVATTFPFAYVTKFAGEDYDVEEHLLASDNWSSLVRTIAAGPNARRLRPYDPSPTQMIMAPLSPGEFIDRLAVLTVKSGRFEGDRLAAVRREYDRYSALYVDDWPDEVHDLMLSLVSLHDANFAVLEKMVPDALVKGTVETTHHVAAMRSNRERVAMKRRIDDLAHAPYLEVKSYYPE